MKKLALTFLFLMLMAVEGRAYEQLNISTWTYTIPLCQYTPYGEPCQAKTGKNQWSYYSANPYNKPSLKPRPVTTEWGPCVEYEITEGSKTIKVTDFDDMPDKDQWPCTRQIGYRSGGVAVWRDPRKK